VALLVLIAGSWAAPADPYSPYAPAPYTPAPYAPAPAPYHVSLLISITLFNSFDDNTNDVNIMSIHIIQ
jgi:hypothetical protein